MGRRLAPYTDTMPKCLVPVAEQPMLRWQIDAFKSHGVSELIIIRGYLGEVLEQRRAELGELPIRFVDNPEYQHNNILESLFCADRDIEGPLLLSYGDIIYTPAVLGALMAAEGDICLVIDRDFASVYEGRTDHGLEQAEVADLGDGGFVRRVGKGALPAADAWGEFIGLLKLSAAGAALFRSTWAELCESFRDRREQPFQRAAHFRQAYLTDLLQHVIDLGHSVTPVGIRGCWREIDTAQDLQRARALIGCAEEDWT